MPMLDRYRFLNDTANDGVVTFDLLDANGLPIGPPRQTSAASRQYERVQVVGVAGVRQVRVTSLDLFDPLTGAFVRSLATPVNPWRIPAAAAATDLREFEILARGQPPNEYREAWALEHMSPMRGRLHVAIVVHSAVGGGTAGRKRRRETAAGKSHRRRA
jgi:hypothetical protein